MATWIVRTSCEFSQTVEASDANEAMDKASKIDVMDWESASWAPYEAEEE